MSFIGNIFGAYAARQVGEFNKSLFKVVFDIPAVTPTGIYTAQTYLIGKNGY